MNLSSKQLAFIEKNSELAKLPDQYAELLIQKIIKYDEFLRMKKDWLEK